MKIFLNSINYLIFIKSLKRIIFISFILIVIILYKIVLSNSKDKNNYFKVTGKIEFLDKRLEYYHLRNYGDYRYIKLDSYKYIFEMDYLRMNPQKFPRWCTNPFVYL